jgi:ATPase subunit of ABC transporter with duplicated ATPase domains
VLLLQRPLSAASSVIDLHGVTCKLGDGRTLFEDVSLSLLANATVGIVGPNGAGKSTFLKLLTGEIQPTEGHVGRTPSSSSPNSRSTTSTPWTWKRTPSTT